MTAQVVHYGKFTITVVDDPKIDEIKELSEVYAVLNSETGVREYESPHLLHCLKYVKDSLMFGQEIEKEIVDILAAQEDGTFTRDDYQLKLFEETVWPDNGPDEGA